MAQKSGFFNALLVESEPDRKYNANDYSDNLAVVISNGVLRSSGNDLKVTAAGMIVSVGPGRGWINGHYYVNDSIYSFPAIVAPIGGKRYDRIMLRLDLTLSSRNVSLVYVQGTAATTPTKPEPMRTDNIYDLVLADLYIDTNATNVVVTDTRADKNICGWVYSTSGDDSFFTALDSEFDTWFQLKKDLLTSVTLFKRYTWSETLASETSVVSFDIPQYDAETCFMEVYVNGILDTDYTLSGSLITFDGSLIAGTQVLVNVYKSIDGTGIMDIADEITELQNAVAALSGVANFTYKCRGIDDNIALSEIAEAFYNGSYTVGSLSQAAEAFLSAIGGNAYLSSLPSDFQATISVSGVLGATRAYSGTGTASMRYRWFNFGTAEQTGKRIVFDFAKCPKINIVTPANSDNIIFYGTDLFIRNATVEAGSTGANSHVTMIVGSNRLNTQFENCRFIVRTSGRAVIAQHGNFINCDTHVKSSGDNAYCFDAKTTSFLRIYGGAHLAYTGTTSKYSTFINIDSTEINAVVLAEDINCPIIAQSGYYQNNYARIYNGKTVINNIITTLNPAGPAEFIVVNNKIPKNKV